MSGKVLFITGTSSGIGAATARAAAQAGWPVALFARSAGKLDALVAEIGTDRALALPGDASSLDDLTGAVGETTGRFGRLDACFANAGRGADSPGVETGNPREWREMLELDVMGLLWTVKAAIPALRESTGHITSP